MPAWHNRNVTSTWRKSRHSGNTANCVEVACGESSVLVRDSHYWSGVMLSFEPEEWSAFMRRMRSRDIG